MRPFTATLFPTALVVLQFLPAILAQSSSAPTLSTFQPINGFSDACTRAYNTPLTDCSDADFSGQGCSAKCIGFLDNLTNLLTTTCVGTSAYPNTLIGLFLNGNGAHTLCSNVGGSSSSSNGGRGNGQGGGQSAAPPVQSASNDASASTTTTTASTSTGTSTSPTSSTPQAAATSSTTTVVPTTITPESTTTSVAVVGITVTPESSSDTSTSTSRTSTSHITSTTSSSSTSTSTSNGNGGGTPLDIGSSACSDAAVSVWLFALSAGLAGVTWLL